MFLGGSSLWNMVWLQNALVHNNLLYISILTPIETKMGQFTADPEVCVDPGFSQVLTQPSFPEWDGRSLVTAVQPLGYEGFWLWTLYHDNFSQLKRIILKKEHRTNKSCLLQQAQGCPVSVCSLCWCLLNPTESRASVTPPAQTLLRSCAQTFASLAH